MAVAEYGTYLYAIARGDAAGAATAVRGVADAPVRTVERAGLTAFVSTVDLGEFGEEGLRRNLEDLRWLETVARAHDGVVDTVSASGACAPLRLATIFLGDDGVRAELDARHDELNRTLDRVDGRVEHGVKAYVEEPTESTQTSDARQSGAAYLHSRRDRLARREQASRQAADVGDQLHRTLNAVVVASRRYPPQEQAVSGHRGRMILNGAYLVESTRCDDLAAFVHELADRHPGVDIALTGPWPPYSFTDGEPP